MDWLLQALGQLPGVDAAQGLRNTGGKLPLYASLLNNFLVSQPHALARIRRHLEQGDLVTAQRMTHTLMGVAATLGASQLCASTCALEQVLSQALQQEVLESALADTETRLGELVQALQPLLGPLNQVVEAARPQPAPGPHLLHTISELLDEHDARAVELWQANAELLKAQLPDGEAVDQAMRDFDFERALELLRAA